MLMLEILLSIHCLLFISAGCISGRWLVSQPSFKLKLARILLASCVLSPVIVHCISSGNKPTLHKAVSLDVIQTYASQPIIAAQQSGIQKPSSFSRVNDINYAQVLLILFFLVMLFRSYRLILSLTHLRSVLREAIPYRKAGRLVVVVSQSCHIPFSVYFLNKAYIVLPVSLLSSAKHIKIAIAHEGQHHRNRDCLWAYVMEAIQIVFFANPGVSRWQKVLTELQEFSCDEVLVGQPTFSAHDYGHCLFKVVQTVSQCSTPSHRELACTVGMALNSENQDRTFLIRRLSMLSNYPTKTSTSWRLGVLIAGVSVLAPICVAYSAVGALTSTQVKAVDLSHVDPRLQQLAESEVSSAVKRYHATSGVIAIADPSTGHILAFAEAGKGNWKSRLFSPGSTIKPFIAAAAIEAGVSSDSKTYECPSPYIVEGKQFTNYAPNKGAISLTDALAKSDNVCFIKVAQEAGEKVIRQKLTEFGFDMNSWWQANQSDDLQLAELSIGENLPVTVETLTKSYAMLANKGHIFSNTKAAAISVPTAQSVTQMLVNAVTNGTGQQAAIPGVTVAGKTGTVVLEKGGNEKATHLALFGGYAPVNAPRYAVVVVLEEGRVNKNSSLLASGGELAAPVFQQVLVKSLKR